MIYVKNTTPSFTTALKARSVSAENQITRIRANLTTAIESHDSVDQRYNAFRGVIERIGAIAVRWPSTRSSIGRT